MTNIKKTFFDLDTVKIDCDYLNCLAGMGLSGNGCCFLGGNAEDKNCIKFENEDEWLFKNGE